ncbi:hypothetical protein TWF718_002823 [Orbilia javanica]|uniref:F-box domain-containing protein n=1 Tax=Orbilia javanica TaxID=47235 RepID=A0AAN8MGQ9_9PEZI
MTTLETLPHDIRYQILTLLPDSCSISSLISSSRPFYTSFHLHRTYFLAEPLLRKYLPEAYLIVALYNNLKLPYTADTYYLFQAAIGNYIDEKFEGYEISHDDDPDTLLSIKKNHEVIVSCAHKFLKEQIYPHHPHGPKSSRNPSGAYKLPPPAGSEDDTTPAIATINEYDNTVGGFYRFWIWTLVHGSRYHSTSDLFGRGKIRRTLDEMTDYLYEAWGFWAVKVTESLMHWCIGWMDVVIDGDEGIKMPPATCELAYPPDAGHDRRDIVGSLLRHNFRGMLESIGDKSAIKAVVQDIITRSPFPPVLTRLERAPGCYKPACPGHIPIYATVVAQSTLELFEPKRVNPEGVEIRPVVSNTVKDRAAYTNLFKQGEMWLTMFCWLMAGVAGSEPVAEGADFWAAVWDDWRLEGWGYWRPEF